MMITIVFKDWFTGQYIDEFTMDGDWSHEIKIAKKIAKSIEADKANKKIIIYYQEVTASTFLSIIGPGITNKI